MSAGRVHEAAVTSVDEERRVVCVEWFEDGETKGKEVRKQAAILYIQHRILHTTFCVHTKIVLCWALFRASLSSAESAFANPLHSMVHTYSLMMDVHSRHIYTFKLARVD